jgi:hypothetical protein
LLLPNKQKSRIELVLLLTAAAANSFSVALPNEGYTERMPNSLKIQESNDDEIQMDLTYKAASRTQKEEKASTEDTANLSYSIFNQTTLDF